MEEIIGENCEIGNKSCCCSSENEKEVSNKEHWENTYKKSNENELGWYQKSADQSLNLIKQTKVNKDELIADIGSGSSILIDNLLENDYSNIIATDISESALEITKNRIQKEDLNKVNFIVDDLLNSTKLIEIKNISIWHDRAVFHFLINEEDRKTYFDLLDNSVEKGKFVIIATFNLNGADKCSGLPVEKYDENKISEFLGEKYKLEEFFNYDYVMPSGAIRPYVYTLFRKVK